MGLSDKSLEAELKSRSDSGSDAQAAGCWKRYDLMRDYLTEKYYPYVRDNCPYHTDHGEGHVTSVVRQASALLQKSITTKDANITTKDASIATKDALSTLDLFLLLSAIVWHDVGMVAKRSGHETAVTPFIDKIRSLAFRDLDEQRIVEEIVAAHTGPTGLERLKSEEDLGLDTTIRPRFLAAVLRFADEISEDRSRISRPVLESGRVPAGNLVFWHYADSISACRVDLQRERVVLTVHLQDSQVVREFRLPGRDTSPERSVTLIEYVVELIGKMNCERAYCTRYFVGSAFLRTIEVRMCLFRGTDRVDEYDEIILLEDEYPQMQASSRFFEKYPKWSVEALREVVQR